MLRRTRFFFILFMALSIAIRVLVLPEELKTRVTQVAIAALLVQFGIWGVALVSFWAAQFVEGGRHADPGSITAVTALGYVAKAGVWLLITLLILANFNINVTALVAGLGVTGIAVALAVQSVLGDLLGALSIVMAKPFVVGEAITVAELTGTVEYVGLRTTRIRSVNGEQVTVPNKQLLENTVRNFTRMTERRVTLAVGVVFETPADVLARLPQEMRTAVEAHGDRVRFERAHLRGIGSGSIDFELVYWIRSPDYGLFADTHQAVVLDVLRRFEAAGALLAYPAQRAIPYDGRMAAALGKPATPA
jgi:small-conductance mechanosensitive channel